MPRKTAFMMAGGIEAAATASATAKLKTMPTLRMVLRVAEATPSRLRGAAPIDGASERQAFFRVVFPVLRPINVVVLVITIIESLRAFDIVYVINRGLNGLELLSVLVTNNILGEASRIGFGSAIAVVLLVISLGPILLFLSRTTADES